jgi:hypothetical protein
MTTSTRLGRRLGAAVTAVLLTTALSACLGETTSSGPLDCTKYQEQAPTDANGVPLLLVMLDIADNSAASAGRVATRIRPYLDEVISGGQYVKLVLSGGDDTGLTYSDCFDGSGYFLIHRNNETREEKDRLAAGNALEEEIDHMVQSGRVTQTGSATLLLSRVNEEVDQIRSTPGVNISEVTVLVWTDLLGMTENTDCLHVDGKVASVTIAEAIVKRCFETGQLTSLGEDKVRFIGVNENSGTRPQQDLARYLKGELCRRISDDCA